jgi:hypothetical protein
VASDRRVFCPSCKERLSAEELAGLTAPATGPASSGRPLAPATPRAPARGPAETLQPLEILPAAEISSPIFQAIKSSPIAVMVLLMGLVGFGCWPVAVGGAALGLNELRRHFTGLSHGHSGLVVASFLANVAAILVRMSMWKGR